MPAQTLLRARPTFEPPHQQHYHLQGFVGRRLQNNITGWMLSAPSANPAMLQIFRDRDRNPRRDLVPWAGEFAGKYLTSAVLALRLTRDVELRNVVQQFVHALIATQSPSGYLGPAPDDQRLVGKTSSGDYLWDIWGHYHCMLGLLLWHQDTGDALALSACKRAADFICDFFLQSGRSLSSANAEEMNMAISHIFCLLYEQTADAHYLKMARTIESEWQCKPAGDYVRTALEGLEFYQTPKPRWESLHDIQAIAEFYYLTGDDRYRQAFEHIWHSIAKGDRHNTGGFSSGEAAVGNPYDPHAIETCCTVAWIALSIDMLRLTGHSIVADEIELATFNGILGAQHPSGRWWTYNTPMDGLRKASAHEIVFQAREGSPELNCCSVNGPRGLGMISDWAVMLHADGFVLNYYGPGTFSLYMPSGNSVNLMQSTRYPVDGSIQVKLQLDRPERFCLQLRIPSWSTNTRVAVNGVEQGGIVPGSYLALTREWHTGDELQLSLDLSPHVWVGEREAAGKASVFLGPLLMAYDRQFNVLDPYEIPTLSLMDLRHINVEASDDLHPWLLANVTCEGNKNLVLCDFASAGAAGTPYISWLPVMGLRPELYPSTHPVWCTALD